MSLPEQARRHAERANELLEQLNAPSAPAEADPPADPPQDPPQPADQQLETPQPPAEPEAPADPPADTPPDPAPQSELAVLEQRYKSLQGILNAEKRTWQQEREQLLAEVRSLKEQLTSTAKPATAEAPPRPKRITEKDLETYGPELIDVINRAAEERAEYLVEEKLKQIQPLIEQTREQVGHVSTQVYRNEQERFFGELAKAVPDFQEVNADERWLAWLAETDPIAGVPRQAFLNDAQKNLDHTRVANLFKAFKATLAPAAAPAPAKTTPPLSPSPRGVGTASAPTPREPQQPSVSRTEIAAHYRRSATDPSYRASSEYKETEARIAAATASGRIVEA